MVIGCGVGVRSNKIMCQAIDSSGGHSVIWFINDGSAANKKNCGHLFYISMCHRDALGDNLEKNKEKCIIHPVHTIIHQSSLRHLLHSPSRGLPYG